jgi:two-component system NtrC family sensor kinase
VDAAPLEHAERRLQQLRRERRYGLGLRWQVLLALGATLTLTVILIGVVVLQVNRGSLERQQLHQVQARANLLAQAAALLLDRQDATGLQALADAAAAPGEPARKVILMDADLRVIAASRGALSSGDGPSAEAAAALFERRTHGHLRDHPREAVVYAPLPTAPGALPRGVLALHAPMDEVDALVDRNQRLLLLYLLLQSLLQLAVGYALLTRQIIRPIGALAEATAAVTAGDDTRHVRVRAANELGHLADDFNAMILRLRQHRLALEQQVLDLERANRDLATAQQSLIRSEKLATVGTLAAGVAHEVGNPLAAVMGYVELLQLGDLDHDESQDLLARTLRELRRMDAIIRELLDVARARRVEHVAQPLRPILDSAAHLLKPQPRHRGVTLTLDLPDDLPWVRVDEGRLQQVIINLLLNAADATQGRGHVLLRAATDALHGAPMVRLDVQDDGPGIAPDDLARLFEPFFTTKPPGQGTGLGLAISHAILDSFGGDLRARSTPGHGATFSLWLPAAAPAMMHTPDDPHGGAP